MLRWERAHWWGFLIKHFKVRSYGNYWVLSSPGHATVTAEQLIVLSIAIWTVLHVIVIFRSCELVIIDYICQNTKIPKGYFDNCHFDVWLQQRSPHVVLHNKLTFSLACTEQCNNVDVQSSSFRVFYVTFILTSRLHNSVLTVWNILWRVRLTRVKCVKQSTELLITYLKADLWHAFFNTVDSAMWGCSNLQHPQSASPNRLTDFFTGSQFI